MIAVVLLAPLVAIGANQASDARLVEDTLKNFAYYRDPAQRRERLDNSRQEFIRLAQSSRQEQRWASFVFSAGQTAEGVIAFVERHGITVVEILAKQPVPDSGTVETSIIGLDWLLAVDGEFGTRLRCAIGIRRANLERMVEAYVKSPMAGDRKRGLQYERMLVEPPRIYRINAFGPASSMASAAGDSLVAAVSAPGAAARWIETYELMTTDPEFKAPPALAYVGMPGKVPASCSGAR